ncbi:SDR family oxidoreductase [Haloarcula onubensis]|uniref:SDR family oxidoreductase n=1 Tax=Haloarcula onubensis TaxID=2950539 RepID=A0ABU2FLZ7_9EURY|nr:SDR family oxidoreductase [Halomicroarcula sp. S3CR25-11]MDS0281312.1 SDR family oxidoreductase [Halomicroarcula sp. S3CR25-11]
MAKTVLITGASSGIGHATAEVFLDDDWQVWATARDEDDIADLAEAGCETAELDVTKAAQCERVVETVVESAGRIDCLVNNAGYAQFGAVEDVSTGDIAASGGQFDVNVYGPHRLIRQVMPHMRARESGTIINVSSVAGRLALPGQGAYAASKFALEALSDALRVEADEYGIDVVLVQPGPVETNFYDRAMAEREDIEKTGAYDWLYTAREDSRLAGIQDALSVTVGTVALTIRDAANASDPEPRYPVGEGAKLILMARHLPARWRDAAFGLIRKLTN